MCGIFGVVNVRKAAELVVIGLHGIQHRASDYAGIVSSDGHALYRESGSGLAHEVFTEGMLNGLHGRDALGHIRYPTVTDDPLLDNTQPIIGRYGDVPIAVAHNGNLTNIEELRKLVPASALSTSMDTELIVRLIEMRHTGNIEADFAGVFSLLAGSFSLGILLPDRLIAVRDPSGNRPLEIGKLNGGYCVSSETCVFPNVSAEHLFSVESGTMVSLGSNGCNIIRFAEACEKKCVFELVYFSHPGSEGIARFRWRTGQVLEERFPVPGADIVTPVPDSSNFVAMGYGSSGRSGTHFPVIYRNHSAARTFTAATQAKRDVMLSQKFTFNASEIRGKTIVVTDDSIVRGTTIPKIVFKLRELGAKAVHVRIGSPPFKYPCRYGIATPTSEELVAASHAIAEMQDLVGADSLEFLPLGVLREMSTDAERFCFACTTGEYW